MRSGRVQRNCLFFLFRHVIILLFVIAEANVVIYEKIHNSTFKIHLVVETDCYISQGCLANTEFSHTHPYYSSHYVK
jgi:hypothetical protein